MVPFSLLESRIDVIPTQILVVSACGADVVGERWARLAPADCVVVVASDDAARRFDKATGIGVIDASRWVTNLLLALAGYGGTGELDRARRVEAFHTARACLVEQEKGVVPVASRFELVGEAGDEVAVRGFSDQGTASSMDRGE